MSIGHLIRNMAIILAISIHTLPTYSGPVITIPIKSCLNVPDDQLNLTTSAFEVCRLIDPSIDVDSYTKQIEEILGKIHQIMRGETDHDKIMGTLVYLYMPGSWNDYETYQYIDFDLALSTEAPMVTHYVDTKRGNCVSMPMLFLILTRELGVDMHLVDVADHTFCRYHMPDGKIVNFELTNEGRPLRDVFIAEQFQISPESIESGIYMRSLSVRETIANYLLIAYPVLMNRKQFDQAIQLAHLSIKNAPLNIQAMTAKGDFFGRILRMKMKQNGYSTRLDVPEPERSYYDQLDQYQRYWFGKADSLGFKRYPIDWNAKYKAILENMKKEAGGN